MSKTILLSSNTSWYLWNFRKGTIKALLDKNYRVICLAPFDEYSALLTDFGVKYIEAPLEGKSIGPIKELSSLFSIFKTIKQEKPDFVFNFTIKMNLYVGLSCRVLNIPYANNVSGLGTAFLHKGLRFKLAQQLYGLSNKGAQKVFFQNEEDQKIFTDLQLSKPENTSLLPGSGIDLNYFAFTPLPERTPFTFIMVARLIADKGVREYVAAAELVKKMHPQVRFLLVGPSGISNQSAISDQELAQWQAAGYIEYVGEQKNIIPWIVQSHVLVLPSYREGMPRTVLEAASIGRPAIVTDVPGCRQAVRVGETAWMCKVKDAEDLANTMKDVIALDFMQIESFSRNARAFVTAHFSEHLVIDKYMACLKD